jgi:leader peptidase (prepilin peptidase)/N-methyltransferase
MVVEVIMALLFVGLYAALYMAGTRGTWWGDVGGPWFYSQWVWRTSPVFCALLVLVAGLMAMTLIDARTFTIPIQIPFVVTVVAFVFHPLQGVILQLLPPSRTVAGLWPIPLTDWHWFAVVLGGMLGIGISLLLLRLKILRYSFEDYDEYVKEGEALAEYPHARREMLWELAFLVPCIAGLVGGWLVGRALPATAPPLAVQALGATFAGYLVGGGLIWGIRILGTFLFGKEAMGAGDIHLLAAVGAVLGCVAPMWVFFLAPFSGLLWVAVSKGLVTVFTKARRELPYGPHLAVATVVVMGCGPVLDWIQANYLPWLP